MIFHFQAVHVHLDPGFVKIAEEKFVKLEKFFPGEPEVYLIVKKEKFEFLIEAKIQYKSFNTFMKTRSTNVNTALDELVDRMKNYLSKKHNRKKKRGSRESMYEETFANENRRENENQ